VSVRVATVQFKPVFKDVKANLQIMNGLAKEAKQGGAELIVFPELCTTGYSFMSEEEARPFGEPLMTEKGPSPSFEHMRELAQLVDAALVWGLVEAAQGVLYNAQCIVCPDGGAATYRKRNLWGNDFLWAAKGDISPAIITWRGRTVGLLICRDIRDKNDKVDEIYEPGDADIVAFSSNFGNGGFPAVSWVDFAVENKTTLVVSNRYGFEGSNNFGHGGICVVRPSGKVECKGLVWDEPCIVYADV
jgi:predicted amidohydrolase